MNRAIYTKQVERWGVFEVNCEGKTEGNPFCDYTIEGTFVSKSQTVIAKGFYDGNGRYKVRFMPSFVQDYTFTIRGSFCNEEINGSFSVLPASENNHGPMRVQHTYHFAYEDGTPYFSIGTTSYVWNLQNDEQVAKTLETLKKSVFNKIRFCLWPKHYDYNLREPRSYPYEGTPMDSSVLTKDNFMQYSGVAKENNWDFERFNVSHFQHIEKCIVALCKMGIEADLIVMHPYDRWGFGYMTPAQDDLYWRYVVARLSAYRNVWWSLANEYDLMLQKTIANWERYAAIICEDDPYNHLRSIHNCVHFYDYTKPWITHCSIQRQDVYKCAEFVAEWRTRFGKPVVLDEIGYEGNIQYGWGNISGKEIVRRFWEATCRGGYAGHGETFLNEEDILWWSHGGELHGESPKRFRFLQKVMGQMDFVALQPISLKWDEVTAIPQKEIAFSPTPKSCYLSYFGFNRPSFREYYFDDTTHYLVEAIDTWNMTIDNQGVQKGKIRVKLPGHEYLAVRLTKQKEK